MQGQFVPIPAYCDGKKERWQIDVSRLGLEELIKLKKELEGISYISTVTTLDALIYGNIEVSKASRGVSGGGRRKELKRKMNSGKRRKKLLEGDKNDKY